MTPAWFAIIQALDGNPGLAYELTARQWEELVAGAYRQTGFDEVILTPASGDRGRDVIATKRALGSVRVIDQVKAYIPPHLVTADDVRALLGVLHADRASKGFLTTTSDFAPRLREDELLRAYIPNQIELVNRATLMDRLQQLSKG